jgi:molybdopterin converting factor small subunit
MATLRLFANLREVAGTAQVEIDGSTVDELLAAAGDRFGADFTRGLDSAKVWVNGEQAGPSTAVASGDEVALIPPVSGGTVAARPESDLTQAGLVLALLVAVTVANAVDLQTFVFVAVGTALAWLWDASEALNRRGATLNVIPLMIGATAAANGAYRWGVPGFAGGLAVAVMVTLAWAVLDPAHRSLEVATISVLVSAVGAMATGGLTLLRMRSTPEVNAFLIIAAVAGVAAWAVHRSGGEIAGLDPNLATLLGALAAGLGVGLVVDSISIGHLLLASVAAAAGLITGRLLGSLLRTGSVVHTARAPGLLTMFDGAALGAAAYWAAIWLFG